MQRTLLGVVLLGLICSSANAAGYYIRFDTSTTSSAFQEFDGVTASSLSETNDIYLGADLVGFAYEELSADLSTGRLAVYQESTSSEGGASSTALFGDTLTFNLGGESFADVTVTMRVHGFFDVHQGQARAELRTGQVLLESAFAVDNHSTDYHCCDDDQYVDDLLSIVVRVTEADPDFAFWSYLQINHLGGGTADFANTAQMSVVVPDGVTFTSASGVFLAEAVPAPPAIWLLGTALAGLGGRRLLKQKIRSTP